MEIINYFKISLLNESAYNEFSLNFKRLEKMIKQMFETRTSIVKLIWNRNNKIYIKIKLKENEFFYQEDFECSGVLRIFSILFGHNPNIKFNTSCRSKWKTVMKSSDFKKYIKFSSSKLEFDDDDEIDENKDIHDIHNENMMMVDGGEGFDVPDSYPGFVSDLHSRAQNNSSPLPQSSSQSQN